MIGLPNLLTCHEQVFGEEGSQIKVLEPSYYFRLDSRLLLRISIFPSLQN